MGATAWTYFVPYEPDPETALQSLREQVFESGDYCGPGEIQLALRQFSSGLPLSIRLLVAGLRAYHAVASEVRWVARGGRGPRSIDEVLELAAENGTHSILDITHTAPAREFAAAVPLSEWRLRETFGTLRPTREQVQEASVNIHDRLHRSEAIYFPVYVDDRPVEWAFVGWFGD